MAKKEKARIARELEFDSMLLLSQINVKYEAQSVLARKIICQRLLVGNWREISRSYVCREENILSISPLSISSLTSFGLLPSTWQPTLNAVPRISLTVPFNSFASDLNRIVRAISMISSRDTDLLCLMFFSFFRSRGGSLRALMTRDEADGTTETAA